MIDLCCGCARCIQTLNDREGEFKQFKGKDAELVGLISCGGCPGVGMTASLNDFKFWNASGVGKQPTHVYVGDCINNGYCPYSDGINKQIAAKMGADVITGMSADKPGVKVVTKGTHHKQGKNDMK
jgi:predicted metal-binding protein